SQAGTARWRWQAASSRISWRLLRWVTHYYGSIEKFHFVYARLRHDGMGVYAALRNSTAVRASQHAIGAQRRDLRRIVAERGQHFVVVLSQLRSQPAGGAGRRRQLRRHRRQLDRRTVGERVLLEHA